MLESDPVYHTPALLSETLQGLAINPIGTYVDVTFGGGGHSRAILEKLNPEGHLYGFDQDLDVLPNLPDDPRFTFVRSNFCHLRNFMRYHDVEQIDGLLADLGVSSHHFDDQDRGFSFRFDAPLDMRMNRESHVTAADILQTYTETRLADLFYLYGELKQSRRLAKTIVDRRINNPIRTTTELVDLVRPLVNFKQEKKELAQLFQALRIEVNGEMEVLRKLLEQTVELLIPGGRIAIITYHSLEDRLVKNFFKSGNFEGIIEKDFFGNPLSPLKAEKQIIPTPEEIARNPRARSARLRVAIKIK